MTLEFEISKSVFGRFPSHENSFSSTTPFFYKRQKSLWIFEKQKLWITNERLLLNLEGFQDKGFFSSQNKKSLVKVLKDVGSEKNIDDHENSLYLVGPTAI